MHGLTIAASMVPNTSATGGSLAMRPLARERELSGARLVYR